MFRHWARLLAIVVGFRALSGCRHDATQSSAIRDSGASRPMDASAPPAKAVFSDAAAMPVMEDGWKLIMEADAHEPAAQFFSVWVSDEHTVYVGGKMGVIRQSRSGITEMRQIGDRDAVMAIWGRSDSDVYAVHWRGGVTHYDGSKWSVERDSGPAGRRPRQMLSAVGPFLGHGSLVAYGGLLSVKRTAQGRWLPLSEAEQRELQSRWWPGRVRPGFCEAAGVESWYRAVEDREWVLCRDRTVYWLQADEPESHGKLPDSCRPAPFRHAFYAGALYVACDDAVLFRNQANQWERDRTLPTIVDMATSGQCLYALGLRALYRRCGS